MSRRLIVRPEAESDIVEVALWYESREAGLGFEVAAQIRVAIKRAVEYPRAHLLLRRSPEVHRVLTQRFPYRIFYIVRSDAVVVFAVLHAARDDRHWKRRL
jgi:plasmid stabilization system protein ParE